MTVCFLSMVIGDRTARSGRPNTNVLVLAFRFLVVLNHRARLGRTITERGVGPGRGRNRVNSWKGDGY